MAEDQAKGSGSPEPDDSYVEDPYRWGDEGEDSARQESTQTAVVPAGPPQAPPAGGPPTPPEDDGEDEDGMLRMSFLEHLEELRSRIIKCLMGLGVAFLASLVFAAELWKIISAPATTALRNLGFADKLVQITPMEGFSVVYVKLPMLVCLFLASPWVLFQVWSFIAPGLYKRERRWAAPFVLISAGLFITGGLFAYFVAFRYGLEFLLGIGRGIDILPMVSITEYFDLFVNVTLGIALVFELPVLIFFLTLLHVVTPGFLLRNSRYAILIIVCLAALITPTPDVFNLLLFAAPMCLLYFVGVYASYLLVLRREKRRFGPAVIGGIAFVTLLLAAVVIYILIAKYGFRAVPSWPFLVR